MNFNSWCHQAVIVAGRVKFVKDQIQSRARSAEIDRYFLSSCLLSQLVSKTCKSNRTPPITTQVRLLSLPHPLRMKVHIRTGCGPEWKTLIFHIRPCRRHHNSYRFLGPHFRTQHCQHSGKEDSDARVRMLDAINGN